MGDQPGAGPGPLNWPPQQGSPMKGLAACAGDTRSWATRTTFMEGQEFHGGNSITIRRAVTIHEANPARPPDASSPVSFARNTALGRLCR